MIRSDSINHIHRSDMRIKSGNAEQTLWLLPKKFPPKGRDWHTHENKYHSREPSCEVPSYSGSHWLMGDQSVWPLMAC